MGSVGNMRSRTGGTNATTSVNSRNDSSAIAFFVSSVVTVSIILVLTSALNETPMQPFEPLHLFAAYSSTGFCISDRRGVHFQRHEESTHARNARRNTYKPIFSSLPCSEYTPKGIYCQGWFTLTLLCTYGNIPLSLGTTVRERQETRWNREKLKGWKSQLNQS